MDEIFLKAADFYRDEARHQPLPAIPLPQFEKDFRFVAQASAMDCTNILRMDYKPNKYGPQWNTMAYAYHSLERLEKEQFLEPMLDAILTQYYHDKWMNEKGNAFINNLFDQLKTKLKKSKRSESVKRSARRLINEFIKEWEGYCE